jgi:molecular chaperone DnaK (HSP70)
MPPDALDTGRPAARFVVGIDLGTTNSAVAFVDTEEDSSAVCTFPIPQLVAPGEIEARDALPSFHYEPAPGQFGATAWRLPWEEESQISPGYIVGVLARDQGAETPGRLIVSAKSWLSHAGVDRTAELLPWHGAPEVKKLSPVEVSARFLGHLRAAWNFRQPAHPLETQEVIVTIPASFDETARELTVAAARRAGLPRIALLEEPQAAFYAWAGEYKADLPRGAKILVCDIGGGTSDFTLIEALEPSSSAAGAAAFRRIAVGDHLILGGDNLDLALARFAEERLGAPLHPRQWGVLLRRCQHAKEILLGSNAPERLTLSVPAAGGARLVGGARQVELERKEAVSLLADGFLPRVGLDAQPARRASGFQEFGLPYAPDPAITRYLAAFLCAHGEEGKAVRPDAVLLNGGFFASPILRERLLETLGSWFEKHDGQRKPAGHWRPQVLENRRLDLAVAVGAARFGLARRGVGAKIAGGLARSYYIGVGRGEKSDAAVCLAPAGLEEGREVDLKERQFDLRLRQPVEFPLYVSSARPDDLPGDLAPLEGGQLTALPPLRTALRGQAEGEDAATVHLHARLTEVGTLEVWCEETAGKRRQWKLPFDVRATTRDSEEPRLNAPEPTASVDEQTVRRCRELIREAFVGSAGAKDAALVEEMVKRLEAAAGMHRLQWPPLLLRSLWEELMVVEPGRVRSAIHEARWLNLLGFSLRPGYGFAVDDWRAAQTWRLFERRIVHPRNELCRAEWHILWRRIAGGLTAGQQRALAAPLLSEWKKSDQQTGKSSGWGTHETAEIWRLLASLEWLGADVKLDLGNRLRARWPEPGSQSGLVRAAVWALGRLGARVPMYGPLNTVLPAEEAERWIGQIIQSAPTGNEAAFALVQMARRTGDRFRDISEDARKKALNWLTAAKAPKHEIELVREGGALHTQEWDAMFGESLPCGLRLIG